jgi:hypothetical protein
MAPDIDTNLAGPSKDLSRGSARPSDLARGSSAPGKRPSILSQGSSVKKSAGISKDASGYFLSGAVRQDILPDILQLVSSNDKTGVFRIERDDKKIELFFRGGQLYHARGEEMSGQTAFFAAMAFTAGTFCFSESEDIPEEATIEGNTQFMILEALRQIDEQSNGE